MARGERDEEVLRVELAAGTEAAADVVLDHIDRVLGEPDLLGENAPVEERHLGRAADGEPARRGVPLGEQAARLHGEAVVALGAKLLAPDIGGGCKGLFDVAAGCGERHRAVGAGNIEEEPVASRGGRAIRHRRQRLDVEDDVLERVLADGDAVGEDDCHRLADIADVTVRDHRLLERLELRQRLQPHGDLRRTARHVLRRDDGVHAPDAERRRRYRSRGRARGRPSFCRITA